MQEINKLLGDVAFRLGTLNQAKSRFSAQLAPDFNLFDYMRSDEMGLSKCIASLLDPKGKHGQGKVFLEVFLDTFLNPEDISDWAKAQELREVVVEKQANGQRRIDIYLDFGKNGCLGIENKPWAGDQEDQLKDYAEHLKNEKDKFILLFLCNREPSEFSIPRETKDILEKDGRFRHLNYGQVIKWLQECAYKSRALPVRIFIEHLIKFIQTNINGELDMSEEDEVCAAILKLDGGLVSALKIYKALPKAKKFFLNEFNNDLEAKLNERGFHLVWDTALESDRWGCYAGFGVKFQKEQKLYLRFEFNSANLQGMIWGIAHEDAGITKDQVQEERWKGIGRLFDEREFGRGKESIRYPWFSENIEDILGIRDARNWESNVTPWSEIKSGTLAEKVCKLADDVRGVFDKKEHMDLLF